MASEYSLDLHHHNPCSNPLHRISICIGLLKTEQWKPATKMDNGKPKSKWHGEFTLKPRSSKRNLQPSGRTKPRRPACNLHCMYDYE